MTAPKLPRRAALALPALFALPRAVRAQTPARLVVLELFTSQGCSSCPPADTLLHRLATSDVTLLPLAFHVTYWNYLGWRDPYSLEAATERQKAYARLTGAASVYTPQLIVDGRRDVIGSDQRAVMEAIRGAAADMPPPPPLRIADAAGEVVVEIGAAPAMPPGLVLLIGYDSEHRTPIGRGENAGRSLLEANIVRSITPLGSWRGATMRLPHARPEGERLAVLVQAADGHILAAATTALPSG
jgi:hypothetical protein